VWRSGSARPLQG